MEKQLLRFSKSNNFFLQPPSKKAEAVIHIFLLSGNTIPQKGE